jgi:predicted nucleic acid-binding protein
MSAYFDTSVLVSLYFRDSFYSTAVALVEKERRIVWTPWQKVEFGNAMRTRLWRGDLTPGNFRGIENAVKTAITAGDMLPLPLPAYALWQEAERLSRMHTPALGVRTLDLLHVAAACVLKSTRFCTFDTRQHALARAAGLSIN